MVVLGGTSGERSVSLDTGKACIKALKKKGYKVKTFDPKLRNFNLINKENIDAIFNALHGRDGEDGIAQTYFEYLRIPYDIIPDSILQIRDSEISSYIKKNRVNYEKGESRKVEYVFNYSASYLYVFYKYKWA